MSEPDRPETPQAPPPPQQQQQYGAYPGGYPPPPPAPYAGYAPPPTTPNNGLGITALVLAIVALVFCWTVVGGIVLGVCAVIVGFLARGRVTRGEATNGGVAIAGIVLGILAVIVSVAFIAIWFGVFDSVGGTDYMDCVSSAGSDQQALEQCATRFQERVEDEFSITLTPTPTP
jgi:Domain of unknown function (DUF4190)